MPLWFSRKEAQTGMSLNTKPFAHFVHFRGHPSLGLPGVARAVFIRG
jgi:hypothetical protein